MKIKHDTIPQPSYLCGPMSGIEDYNYPVFNEAEDSLRGAGFSILNPTLGFSSPPVLVTDQKEQEFFARSIRLMVNRASSVIVLPGYDKSYNAGNEIAIARSMGLPIYKYPTLEPLEGFGCILLDARFLAMRPEHSANEIKKKSLVYEFCIDVLIRTRQVQTEYGSDE